MKNSVLALPKALSLISIPSLNGLAIKIVLLSMAFWAHRSDLKWAFQTSAQRTDKIALIICCVVLPAYIFRRVKIYSPVHWARPALALLAVAGFAGAVNALSAGLPQIGIVAFVLSLFAWAGLNQGAWPQWRGQLKFALLIAFALAFYLEFSSGFGFGLRLLTAGVVEDILSFIGIGGVSSQDVVIVENAIAHIDAPCSGLKSLLVGSGFFLGLVIAFDAVIGPRVIAAYVLMLALLFYANVFRVTILVVLNSVLHAPRAAEIVHEPLGILGFCVSCALAFLTFKFWPPQKTKYASPAKILGHPAVKFLAMSIAVLPMLVMAASDKANENPPPRDALLARLDASVALQSLALSTGEKKYFDRSAATSAAKYLMRAQGVEGSVLVVRSRDFNMFHAPELCMAANGVKVDSMKTVTLDSKRRIRVMSLNGGQATGVYWLQAGADAIDGFGERFWRYLWFGEKDWTMIAMIVDRSPASDADLIENFVLPFYAAAQSAHNQRARL